LSWYGDNESLRGAKHERLNRFTRASEYQIWLRIFINRILKNEIAHASRN
jgi:hypothetical protein